MGIFTDIGPLVGVGRPWNADLIPPYPDIAPPLSSRPRPSPAPLRVSSLFHRVVEAWDLGTVRGRGACGCGAPRRGVRSGALVWLTGKLGRDLAAARYKNLSTERPRKTCHDLVMWASPANAALSHLSADTLWPRSHRGPSCPELPLMSGPSSRLTSALEILNEIGCSESHPVKKKTMCK